MMDVQICFRVNKIYNAGRYEKYIVYKVTMQILYSFSSNLSYDKRDRYVSVAKFSTY